MRSFVGTLPDKELLILDIGSQIVSRQSESYRPLFTNSKWKYTGADITQGNNVDIVLEQQYKWQFEDNVFDVIISGQTIEHVEYPWEWFKEMARILKPGGICCIIAPAVFKTHRFPIDTYRYYPDGMKALAKWSGLKVIKSKRVALREIQDTYLVGTK